MLLGCLSVTSPSKFSSPLIFLNLKRLRLYPSQLCHNALSGSPFVLLRGAFLDGGLGVGLEVHVLAV